MTSSTKPEVHNVLQRRQRSAESRSQSTSSENLVMLQRVVRVIRLRTNRQTHTHIIILRSPSDDGLAMLLFLELQDDAKPDYWPP